MPRAQLGFRSHRQMLTMALHTSSFRPCCLSVACSIRSTVDLPSISQNSTHMHSFFCAVSNLQLPFPARACVWMPRCPKVFFPVEFLHSSQCVSQYLNVCHHASQRTLPRCEFTSLHYFGRKHLNMHPADLEFSTNTSSQKTEIGASRLPFQQQRRSPPHSTTGIVVQRNKVPSTRLNQRELERLSVDQLQHLLMNIWTKISLYSRPTIRPYNDVTMPKRCEKFTGPRCSHLLTSSTKNYSSYHPTLSWTSRPAGMVDGVMTARKFIGNLVMN